MTAVDALEAFETAPLRPRYGWLIGFLMAHGVVELFDFYVVGYLISVVAPQWRLTFGQGAIMLLAAGLGQVIFAIPMARIADQWGRRPVLIASILIYSVAAGSIAFTPTGGWGLFALLRFVVGIGYAGALTAQITLVVEFSPKRLRTILSNASGAIAPLGVLIASLTASILLGELGGWRGLAALGFVPLIFALIFAALVPESPRWLTSKRRTAEARDVIARYVRLAPETLAEPAAPATPAPPRLVDLYADPGRFWMIIAMVGAVGLAAFTVSQWGPTIVSQLLRVGPAKAAGYFIFISLAGFAGRIVFTFLPQLTGRWGAAVLTLAGSAAALAAAALFRADFVGPLPAFFVCILIGALFWDGGMTNVAPYCVELFPVRIAAQGGALGNAMTGLTKIVGPMLLALIAGSNNLIKPAATASAVLPAFLTMAGACVIGGVVLFFLRYETHGRTMLIEDDTLPETVEFQRLEQA
jgi:putative MFS transporter